MGFFEGWLQEQSDRDRSIILDLATGETTGAVARKYGVSDGLISQYRKRYRASWLAYISDKKEAAEQAA
jgi:transposase-like protein